ncbi:MAG: hypothetical protein AB7G11_08785, partial [Phycisphaerales bacterium]
MRNRENPEDNQMENRGEGRTDPDRAHVMARLDRRGWFSRLSSPLAAGASASAAALAAADDGPAEVDPGAMLVRLLRRTGYGVRPEDREYVSARGCDAYLNEQGNPATLDESTLAADAA